MAGDEKPPAALVAAFTAVLDAYYEEGKFVPRQDVWDALEAAYDAITRPNACDAYRPDHNGECFTCDEPYAAHTPAARGE